MICNQLKEATQALVRLRAFPSPLDITRVVCGSCQRIECCPSLSMDHIEVLDAREVSEEVLKSSRLSHERRPACKS